MSGNRSLRRRGGNNVSGPVFPDLPEINLRDIDRSIYDSLEQIDASGTGGEGVALVAAPPEDALIYQDGAIIHQRFRITPTGLQIPDDITPEEWAGIGQLIKTIESAGQWAAGDWAAHAVRMWDVSYAEIADQFDYAPETLESYASVSRNVPIARRNPRLSFSHHRLVANRHPRDQETLLNKAFDEDGRPLSLAEFKAVLSGKPLRRTSPPKTRMGRFNADLTSFAEKQIRSAQKAKPSERRQMATMLRQLADTIESIN